MGNGHMFIKQISPLFFNDLAAPCFFSTPCICDNRLAPETAINFLFKNSLWEKTTSKTLRTSNIYSLSFVINTIYFYLEMFVCRKKCFKNNID